MITKASGWQNAGVAPKRFHLTSGMRAVRNWVTLEEHDCVLDLFCRDCALLSSLSEKLKLNVCGICRNPEDTRAIREQLYNGDIVYALPHDIPWRDNAFDAVLAGELVRRDNAQSILRETNRVLRPGGQVVMLTTLFSRKNDAFPEKRELMRMMQSAGFESVSWRMSGLWGVAVGWKKVSERA